MKKKDNTKNSTPDKGSKGASMPQDRNPNADRDANRPSQDGKPSKPSRSH